MRNTEVPKAIDHLALLSALPQTEPFRFVNEILEVSQTGIVVSCKFDGSEFFYKGHFPGDPVTPGVILLEAMAQGAGSLQAQYLLTTEKGIACASHIRMMLSDCAFDVYKPVIPPAIVTVQGKVVFWRGGKLRTSVEMFDIRQSLIATATIGIIGVKQ